MEIRIIEASDLKKLTSVREGEEKIGQKLIPGSELVWEKLKDEAFQFVILGICEDIGPRANLGKGGAEKAWEAFLPKLINLQENQYLSGKDCCLFGNLHFENKSQSVDELREAVVEIDNQVSSIIQKIVAAGKIPIVIGGGHNNAYGLLKGSSLAMQQAINCINLDPHADFRPLEGRHSGNGFSYAKKEGFLGNYGIVALHENYNSQAMLEQLKSEGVRFNFFERIFIRQEQSFETAVQEQLDFVKSTAFGVELDMDSIEGFPASAQTPSGISPNMARQYVHKTAVSKNAIYLHLPEAAPALVENSAEQVGKLLAYLVSDFVKAKSSKMGIKV
tara:strand:+ start:2808 stop:3806 length:999 start_codon:yes stop_codon:yes gene_type:complete